MKKNAKIYLLKDRPDYIKKLSDDDIINVIGTKGSGKTTSANKYIYNDDYINSVILRSVFLRRPSINCNNN